MVQLSCQLQKVQVPSPLVEGEVLLLRGGGTVDIMGFAVRVRSASQKYGPTCHQSDRADVTEFVTLVRLSSLGQHVWRLAVGRI